MQKIALEMFTAHGFEQTTVAQVAAAAGTSQMTFFRHFPTKESVVLDDPFDPAIGAAVAAQPAELSAVERVCGGLRSAIAELDLPQESLVRARIKLVGSTPALHAGVLRNTAATQHIVGEALRNTGVCRFEAEVAAAACLGALTAALLDWGLQARPEPLADRLRSALDLLCPTNHHGV